LFAGTAAHAQVNSGSDGHDGAFNPTATNTVVDMADRPDGIYHYTEVNIPAGVVVSSIPDANNSPVVRPFPIRSDSRRNDLRRPDARPNLWP
jgi:hypothetical protein